MPKTGSMWISKRLVNQSSSTTAIDSVFGAASESPVTVSHLSWRANVACHSYKPGGYVSDHFGP